MKNIGPAPIEKILIGKRMVAVKSLKMGLSSTFVPPGRSVAPGPPPPLRELEGLTAQELAGRLLAPPREENPPVMTSLGLAALNSMLPIPRRAVEAKGQDLIRTFARGGAVVVVGHFPFVEKMRNKFKSFHVLELKPGPGDLAADQAAKVLPQADLAALTATSLLNSTLAQILSLCRPECFKIMLGPSTPFSASLFDHGLDALSGIEVADEKATARDLEAAVPFKTYAGVRHLTWFRRADMEEELGC